MKKETSDIQNTELVLYQPDNDVKLEVRLENDTVWLNTSQMAVLFDREDSNIRRHINNIFKEGELTQDNNVHFLHVNGVKKPVPFYNLDVNLSEIRRTVVAELQVPVINLSGGKNDITTAIQSPSLLERAGERPHNKTMGI